MTLGCSLKMGGLEDGTDSEEPGETKISQNSLWTLL